MNTVTPEKKDKMTKTLAILGFLTVIALIVVASIAIIRYIPQGFSSLASLSETLNEYKDDVIEEETEIVLTSTTTEAISDAPVVISWDKVAGAGTYSFYYDCVDGITVDIVDTEGLRTISCDTTYDLGDTNQVTIIAMTTKDEETIDYTISFTPENATEPTTDAFDSLFVMKKEDGQVAGESDWQDQVATNDTPTPYLGAPEPTPTPTPEPRPRPVPVPAGYVDLAVSFVSTGAFAGNRFEAGRLEAGEEGAVQFQVINSGTKASSYWSYTVTLPDGGTYTAPLQAPLLPGERATISLEVPTERGSHTFVILAVDNADKYLGNNSVRKEVEIRN